MCQCLIKKKNKIKGNHIVSFFFFCMNILTYFQMILTTQLLMFWKIENNVTLLTVFMSELIIWLLCLIVSLRYVIPELKNSCLFNLSSEEVCLILLISFVGNLCTFIGPAMSFLKKGIRFECNIQNTTPPDIYLLTIG